MKVKCIKSLYKSTYGSNAFVKNKTYSSSIPGDDFIWIKDEEGNTFSFSKDIIWGMYQFDDYFVEYRTLRLEELLNEN